MHTTRDTPPASRGDDAWDRGCEFGRLSQREMEATRVLGIMELREAQHRPIAAWDLIPFGFTVEQTRQQLAAAPLEEMRVDDNGTMMTMLRERVRLCAEALANLEGRHARKH